MTGPQNVFVKNQILYMHIPSFSIYHDVFLPPTQCLPTHTHIYTQSAEMLDAIQVRHVSIPSISSHTAVHTDLLPYSALVKWLREQEPLRFSDVMEVQA